MMRSVPGGRLDSYWCGPIVCWKPKKPMKPMKSGGLMPKAVHVSDAIAPLPVLRNRRPETQGPEADAAFAILAKTRNGGLHSVAGIHRLAAANKDNQEITTASCGLAICS